MFPRYSAIRTVFISENVMNPVLLSFAVCLLAALSTLLGGVAVWRKDALANPRLLAFGLSFAAGAMVYVSFVEIFDKARHSFSIAYGESTGYMAATLAFFTGVMALVLLDRLIPNPHEKLEDSFTVDRKKVARVGAMAAMAITAHNFPEGLATFFATLDNPAVGASLAVAIGVHNIPEGVSIAIPVYYATQSRKKAFLACLLSALAEPVGAFIGYVVLHGYLVPSVFGGVFGFIAGAMVYLSLDELLPTAKRYAKGHETVYGMVIGMAMMGLSLVLMK